MRKALILSVLSAGLSSCLGADWTLAQRRTMDQVMEPMWHRRTGDSDSVSVADTLVYFCGVSFPEGYDWIRDTALGNGEAEVFLLENSRRKLSLRSGYACKVSQDPDTHHIVNGDLYTEFSLSGRTCVKKNGEDLFDYEGREKIDWLTVDGDVVYTLGRSLSGEGFSLRKNGGALLERSSGTIIKGLHSDSGHLYFFYTRTTAGVTSYYMVEDGLESPISPPGTGGPVKDLVVWGGEVHILSSDGMGFFVKSSVWDSDLRILGNYTFENPGFIVTGNGPYVCGAVCRSGWYSRKLIAVSPSGETSFFNIAGGSLLYDSGAFSACLDSGSGTVDLCLPGGQSCSLSGVSLFGSGCTDFKEGILAAGLTPRDFRQHPQTWVNGKTGTLDCFGYLSGVEIIPPSSASSNRQD